MPLEPLLDQSEVKRLPKRRKAGKGNLIVDQQIMINLSTFEEYLSDRNRFAVSFSSFSFHVLFAMSLYFYEITAIV